MPDQDTVIAIAASALTGYLLSRLIGRRAWTVPVTLAATAAFSLWWLAGAGHGFHVMALAGIITLALGLRRGFAARRAQEARLAEANLDPAAIGTKVWFWHGAGLIAAFASLWILLGNLFLDGAGFQGPRLAIFVFYVVYLLVSTGALRRFSPPPLSVVMHAAGRGLFNRRTA